MAASAIPTPNDERYSINELRRLLQKAEQFAARNAFSSPKPATLMARDKTEEYYDEIFNDHSGFMAKYMTDNHGDPKNPINLRLEGLFFSVNVDKTTGELYPSSIYGSRRLTIPIEEIITEDTNLYFSDFYCIYNSHYVRLVLCVRGSESDDFCAENLVPLQIRDNKFISKNIFGNFKVTNGVWVEILYTESVQITDEWRRGMTDVAMEGRRSGGAVGLKKNRGCLICSL